MHPAAISHIQPEPPFRRDGDMDVEMTNLSTHPCHRLSIPAARLFWCRHCMQIFEDPITRWRHSKTCLNSSSGKAKRDKDGSTMQVFLCTNNLTVKSKSLRQKLRSRQNSRPDLRCLICKKTFVSIGEMREHVRYPCRRRTMQVPPEIQIPETASEILYIKDGHQTVISLESPCNTEVLETELVEPIQAFVPAQISGSEQLIVLPDTFDTTTNLNAIEQTVEISAVETSTPKMEEVTKIMKNSTENKENSLCVRKRVLPKELDERLVLKPDDPHSLLNLTPQPDEPTVISDSFETPVIKVSRLTNQESADEVNEVKVQVKPLHSNKEYFPLPNAVDEAAAAAEHLVEAVIRERFEEKEEVAALPLDPESPVEKVVTGAAAEARLRDFFTMMEMKNKTKSPPPPHPKPSETTSKCLPKTATLGGPIPNSNVGSETDLNQSGVSVEEGIDPSGLLLYMPAINAGSVTLPNPLLDLQSGLPAGMLLDETTNTQVPQSATQVPLSATQVPLSGTQEPLHTFNSKDMIVEMKLPSRIFDGDSVTLNNPSDSLFEVSSVLGDYFVQEKLPSVPAAGRYGKNGTLFREIVDGVEESSVLVQVPQVVDGTNINEEIPFATEILSEKNGTILVPEPKLAPVQNEKSEQVVLGTVENLNNFGTTKGTQIITTEGTQIGTTKGTKFGISKSTLINTTEGTQIGTTESTQIITAKGTQISTSKGTQVESSDPLAVKIELGFIKNQSKEQIGDMAFARKKGENSVLETSSGALESTDFRSGLERRRSREVSEEEEEEEEEDLEEEEEDDDEEEEEEEEEDDSNVGESSNSQTKLKSKKLFKCKVCSNTFKTSQALHKHSRIPCSVKHTRSLSQKILRPKQPCLKMEKKPIKKKMVKVSRRPQLMIPIMPITRSDLVRPVVHRRPKRLSKRKRRKSIFLDELPHILPFVNVLISELSDKDRFFYKLGMINQCRKTTPSETAETITPTTSSMPNSETSALETLGDEAKDHKPHVELPNDIKTKLTHPPEIGGTNDSCSTLSSLKSKSAQPAPQEISSLLSVSVSDGVSHKECSSEVTAPKDVESTQGLRLSLPILENMEDDQLTDRNCTLSLNHTKSKDKYYQGSKDTDPNEVTVPSVQSPCWEAAPQLAQLPGVTQIVRVTSAKFLSSTDLLNGINASNERLETNNAIRNKIHADEKKTLRFSESSRFKSTSERNSEKIISDNCNLKICDRLTLQGEKCKDTATPASKILFNESSSLKVNSLHEFSLKGALDSNVLCQDGVVNGALESKVLRQDKGALDSNVLCQDIKLKKKKKETPNKNGLLSKESKTKKCQIKKTKKLKKSTLISLGNQSDVSRSDVSRSTVHKNLKQPKSLSSMATKNHVVTKSSEEKRQNPESLKDKIPKPMNSPAAAAATTPKTKKKKKKKKKKDKSQKFMVLAPKKLKLSHSPPKDLNSKDPSKTSSKNYTVPLNRNMISKNSLLSYKKKKSEKSLINGLPFGRNFLLTPDEAMDTKQTISIPQQPGNAINSKHLTVAGVLYENLLPSQIDSNKMFLEEKTVNSTFRNRQAPENLPLTLAAEGSGKNGIQEIVDGVEESSVLVQVPQVVDGTNINEEIPFATEILSEKNGKILVPEPKLAPVRNEESEQVVLGTVENLNNFGTTKGTQIITTEGTQIGSTKGTKFGISKSTLINTTKGTQVGTSKGTKFGISKSTLVNITKDTQIGTSKGTQISTSKGTKFRISKGTQMGSSKGNLIGTSKSTLISKKKIPSSLDSGNTDSKKKLKKLKKKMQKTLPPQKPNEGQICPQVSISSSPKSTTNPKLKASDSGCSKKDPSVSQILSLVPAKESLMYPLVPSNHKDMNPQVSSSQKDIHPQVPSSQSNTYPQVASHQIDMYQKVPTNQSDMYHQVPSNQKDMCPQVLTNQSDTYPQVPFSQSDTYPKVPTNQSDTYQQVPSNQSDTYTQVPPPQKMTLPPKPTSVLNKNESPDFSYQKDKTVRPPTSLKPPKAGSESLQLSFSNDKNLVSKPRTLQNVFIPENPKRTVSEESLENQFPLGKINQELISKELVKNLNSDSKRIKNGSNSSSSPPKNLELPKSMAAPFGANELRERYSSPTKNLESPKSMAAPFRANELKERNKRDSIHCPNKIVLPVRKDQTKDAEFSQMKTNNSSDQNKEFFEDNFSRQKVPFGLSSNYSAEENSDLNSPDISAGISKEKDPLKKIGSSFLKEEKSMDYLCEYCGETFPMKMACSDKMPSNIFHHQNCIAKVGSSTSVSGSPNTNEILKTFTENSLKTLQHKNSTSELMDPNSKNQQNSSMRNPDPNLSDSKDYGISLCNKFHVLKIPEFSGLKPESLGVGANEIFGTTESHQKESALDNAQSNDDLKSQTLGHGAKEVACQNDSAIESAQSKDDLKSQTLGHGAKEVACQNDSAIESAQSKDDLKSQTLGHGAKEVACQNDSAIESAQSNDDLKSKTLGHGAKEVACQNDSAIESAQSKDDLKASPTSSKDADLCEDLSREYGSGKSLMDSRSVNDCSKTETNRIKNIPVSVNDHLKTETNRSIKNIPSPVVTTAPACNEDDGTVTVLACGTNLQNCEETLNDVSETEEIYLLQVSTGMQTKLTSTDLVDCVEKREIIPDFQTEVSVTTKDSAGLSSDDLASRTEGGSPLFSNLPPCPRNIDEGQVPEIPTLPLPGIQAEDFIVQTGTPPSDPLHSGVSTHSPPFVNNNNNLLALPPTTALEPTEILNPSPSSCPPHPAVVPEAPVFDPPTQGQTEYLQSEGEEGPAQVELSNRSDPDALVSYQSEGEEGPAQVELSNRSDPDALVSYLNNLDPSLLSQGMTILIIQDSSDEPLSLSDERIRSIIEETSLSQTNTEQQNSFLYQQHQADGAC